MPAENLPASEADALPPQPQPLRVVGAEDAARLVRAARAEVARLSLELRSRRRAAAEAEGAGGAQGGDPNAARALLCATLEARIEGRLAEMDEEVESARVEAERLVDQAHARATALIEQAARAASPPPAPRAGPEPTVVTIVPTLRVVPDEPEPGGDEPAPTASHVAHPAGGHHGAEVPPAAAALAPAADVAPVVDVAPAADPAPAVADAPPTADPRSPAPAVDPEPDPAPGGMAPADRDRLVDALVPALVAALRPAAAPPAEPAAAPPSPVVAPDPAAGLAPAPVAMPATPASTAPATGVPAAEVPAGGVIAPDAAPAGPIPPVGARLPRLLAYADVAGPLVAVVLLVVLLLAWVG